MRHGAKRLLWRASWMTAFGAAMTVAGVGIAVAGGVVQGLATMCLGAGILAAAPLRLPVNRRELPEAAPVDGTSETALVFRYSNRAVRTAGVSMGFFTATMVMVAVWPEEIAAGEPLARPFGVVAALLLGAMLLVGVGNWRRGGSLALSPKGLRNGRPGFGLFVPWDAIERVVPTRALGVGLIGVYVSDRSSIEATRIARFLIRLDRGLAGDVTLSPAVFQVEPDWVLETIKHYLEHPGDRRELGTVDAVKRFVRIAWATEEART